jgi:hypothetical protein
MHARKIAFHVLHTNEQFTVSLCEAASRTSWDARPFRETGQAGDWMWSCARRG